MKAARFSRRSRDWLMDVHDRHTVPPMRRERVAILYVRIRAPPIESHIMCGGWYAILGHRAIEPISNVW